MERHQSWKTTFPKSLIIHQVKTRKSQPWRRLGYPVLINVYFYFSVYSLVFEEMYQTLKTVIYWLSKHLEYFHQTYSAVHCIFNSLLCVWIWWWNTVSCVWYITSGTWPKLVFTQMLKCVQKQVAHPDLHWANKRLCGGRYQGDGD